MPANKYAKLKRLLIQQAVTQREYEAWANTERDEDAATVASQIARLKFQWENIEHLIQNEMRARLGIPSGTLTIKKEERHA